MSRLIDADRLKTVIVKTIEALARNPRFDGLQTIHMVCAFDTVGKIVDNAPTVDAVPVVRCGNCRWYDKSTASGTYEPIAYKCKLHRRFTIDDQFCSDGERKDDAGV